MMDTSPPSRIQLSSKLIAPFYLVVVLITTAVLLALALRHPPAWQLDLGEQADERFVVGFWNAERDGDRRFRWSSPESQISLFGATGQRLRMRMFGDGARQSPEDQLTISTQGQTVGRFLVEGGWRTYHILLPPQSHDGVIPIDLSSRAYQDPYRVLGAAAIDWVQVAPLNDGWVSWQKPLEISLSLVWFVGVALLSLAFIYLSVARRKAMVPIWVCATLTLFCGLILWWATFDPYSFYLIFPAMPFWQLLLLSLVLLTTLGLAKRSKQLPKELNLPSAAIVIGLIVLLHGLIFAPLPLNLRGIAVIALLTLPGVLFALRWFRTESDPLIRIFLSVSGGLAFQQLLLFGLQALPGPLSAAPILIANGLALGLICAFSWKHWQAKPFRITLANPRLLLAQLPLIFVLLLAGYPRLVNLGIPEFQADEIRPIYLAAGVLHGHEQAIWLHRKGPTEILLPAGPMLVLGQTNELLARLPFALAGMAIVLGGFLLCRLLFSSRFGMLVALLVAGILSLDGYLIAFSRIVQYQSLVVLMGIAAIGCVWRFYSATPSLHYLLAAALFAAMSMFAHYDGIFILPVVAGMAMAGCWRQRWPLRGWLQFLWPPTLVGLAVLLSFYGPFFFSERFERTTSYLGRRLSEQPAFVESTGGPPFNNLLSYAGSFGFYNTTYQLYWYASVLIVALLIASVRFVRPQPLGYALASMAGFGFAALVLKPDLLLLPGGGSAAGLFLGLPLLALLLSSHTPSHLRFLLLWFIPPFFGEAFIIAKPDTHFYNIHVPAAFLIGYALVSALVWMRRILWLRMPLITAHMLVILLAVPYANLLFVRAMPQYVSLYPSLRPAVYSAFYGDKRPAGGSFAFPNRSGWKVVGSLYETGQLQGDFESNGMKQLVGWYTRDTFRCYEDPKYYFIDRLPRNPVKIPIDDVLRDYHLYGSVMVEGVRMLDIYSREPLSEPPARFELDDFVDAFEAQAITNFPTSRLLTNEIVPQYELEGQWQQGIQLRGYDLDKTVLESGQEAVISFYWQAAAAIEPGYEVQVEIVDQQGQVLGTASPYCGGDPAEEWYTQYVNDIAFKVIPSDQIPAGSYQLRVGLRQQQSGLWLPLANGDETLPFSELRIEASE
jgi:hypothetical protein